MDQKSIQNDAKSVLRWLLSSFKSSQVTSWIMSIWMMMKAPGGQVVSNHSEWMEKVREIIAVDGNFVVRMLVKELSASTGTIWAIWLMIW